MPNSKLKSDLILLLAAWIWGFAFVYQRLGMEYVGPFTYNGVRFSLGAIMLLPFLWFRARKSEPMVHSVHPSDRRKILIGTLMTGLFLFGGVSLQQLGLQTTTAGKAGFLTGLYVVLVPFVGLLFGQRSTVYMWIGAILSFSGLYLLSITTGFHIDPGDKLVLLCAFVFTFHVLFIGWLSPVMDSFLLAVIQFAICAILNLAVAFTIEKVAFNTIMQAWIPIAYGGILSVGIAYTLQVIAQKTAHPAYASIILSLEAVFAVLGGWLILHEQLTTKMLIGCVLMLAGMIVVQVKNVLIKK
jgi:drug/metabolite transporter (DMT)-like permease